MTASTATLTRLSLPPSIVDASAVRNPTLDELLTRAAALAPLIRDRARRTEGERRVSSDVTQMLIDAGLYRVLQPRRFGGYELDIEDLRRLAFEIGRGCASTGWCYGLSAAVSWVVGMFPDEAQEEVWGDSPNAVAASCIAPTGKARPVDGGFMLKGRWGFASNCDNSSWLSLGAMVETGEGQAPRPIFLLVPERDYRIIDNWHTVGLAGTGSKDIAIEEEVFVPTHRTVSFRDVLEQDAPGAEVNRAPLYRIPFLSGFPPMLANPAVAEAECAVDAAQLILQRDLRAVTDMATCGEKPSVEQRIEYRRGHAYAVRLCVNAINGLYDVVGGTGIQLDSGVQRAWRDINAVAHHISVNWQTVSTMYGQMRLGLPPRGQY